LVLLDFKGDLDGSSLIFVEGVFRNFSRLTFVAEKCVQNYFFEEISNGLLFP
tara:strand:- start:161 stop:316 length:156 start_codon:yes stop_codon:yes gene_type:complete